MGTWWLARADRVRVQLRTPSGRVLNLGGSDGFDIHSGLE
jgi:hypothetical protein